MAHRTIYSDEDVRVLLEAYEECEKYLPKAKKTQLSRMLGHPEINIQTWFANRRAKDRRRGIPVHRPGIINGAVATRLRVVGQMLAEYVRNNALPMCLDIDFRASSIFGPDMLLQITITNNAELSRYFEETIPPLFCGTLFQVVANLGNGVYGRAVLAKYIPTNKMVVVKIPLQVEERPNYIEQMLKEFMYQERAYNALKGMACTAPEPLGFMRMRSHSVPQGFIYLSVSEFMSVQPNVQCTLTLRKALHEHQQGRSILDKNEWMTLIQDIIDATNILQRNGISHNDIKDDNIMVHYGMDVRPKAVLIDYGISSSLTSTSTGAYLQFPEEGSIYDKHNAPELFLQQPMHTSDLYSVGRLSQLIGNYLGIAEVQTVADQFCRVPFTHRQGHQSFYQTVSKAFNGEIPVHHIALEPTPLPIEVVSIPSLVLVEPIPSPIAVATTPSLILVEPIPSPIEVASIPSLIIVSPPAENPVPAHPPMAPNPLYEHRISNLLM